jgi:hypothetical protein
MTKEDRIRAHYKAEYRRRNIPCCAPLSADNSNLILYLARHWRLPCSEIKRIVGLKATKAQVYRYIIRRKIYLCNTLYKSWYRVKV